jgi:hypothetical protein
VITVVVSIASHHIGSEGHTPERPGYDPCDG